MASPDIEQALRGYLQPGERIRWAGAPAQGLRFAARDALLVPFSLMWGGFAVFWEFTVVNTPAPGFFALWGVPFVLVGVYIIAGRFFADAWARARTTYAITDRRVVILQRLFSERVLSAGLDSKISLVKERDGRGTLEFGPEPGGRFGGRRGWGMWTPAFDGRVRFTGVEDVMSVYRLLGSTPPAA